MTTLRAIIDATGGRQGASEFARAGDDVVRTARNVDGRLRGVDGRFVAMNRSAITLRRTLGTVFVGLSAGAALRGAVNTISGFEETLVTLQGVTRATADEFDLLSATAQNLGATTRFTAQDAAEGLLFLARAGFDATESIEAIPATLDLAAVGFLDLGTAADLASNVVSQFSLATSETERVVDALTIVSNRANTNIAQLGEALKFAGPTFALVGDEVEVAAAALGVLGDRGIQASMAGTNLRQAVLRLVDPTADARRVFDELSLSLDEVNPERVGVIAAFEALGAANLNAAQASAIFGVRNANAGVILAENTDRIRELVGDTREFAGETGQLAAAVNDTLAGSFRSLRSAVEALTLSLGSGAFSGTLQTVIEALTDGIRVLAGFDEQLNGTRGRAEAVAAVLRGGLGFLAAAAAIKAATIAVGLFTSALAVSGIGLIPIAIGAATVAFIEFREEIFDTTIAGARLGDLLVAAAEEIQERFEFVFPRIREVAILVFDSITLNVRNAFETIVGFTNELSQQISDRFGLGFDSAAGFARDFANFTIASFTTVGDVLRGIIDVVLQAQASLGRLDFSSPIALAASLREIGSTNFDNLVDTLDSLGDSAVDNFSTDFIGAAEDIGARVGEEFLGGFRGFEGGEALEEFFSIGDDIFERAGMRAGEREAQARVQAFLDTLGAEGFAIGPFGTLIPIGGGGGDAAGGAAPVPTPQAFGGGGPTIDQQEVTDRLRDSTEALQFERDALNDSNTERELRIALLELERVGLDESAAAFQDFRNALVELEEAERVNEVAGGIADAFTDAAASLTETGATIESFLENLLRNLTDFVFQEIVLAQLRQSIQGFFGAGGVGAGISGGLTLGAKGLAFDRGQITPLQQGGAFINGPTLLPLSGQNNALAGEAGPELLLPAQRDSRGRLSVNAAGAGSNITVNQTIQTPDANSFRKSRRQIEADAVAVTRRLE